MGTLGRINKFNKSISKYEVVVADSHVTVIRSMEEYVLPEYLLRWFSGPKVQGEINSKSTGSTKQTELGTGTIKEYVVPIPPLQEQYRIVQRVDTLMNLCDKLEVQINKAKSKNELLLKSILKQYMS